MRIHPLDRKAPDGARCRHHPDRPASYRCPVCGGYVCHFCWNEAASRCRSCSMSDGQESAYRMPFEDAALSFWTRVIETVRTAFRPRVTALGFAACRPLSALLFLLISALPLSLAAGVIPHTRTLLFGPGLRISLVGSYRPIEIAFDIVRAMIFQLLFDGIFIAALVIPFASLAKSYGGTKGTSAAIGTVFYRYWLIPAAMLLSYISFWIFPDVRIGFFVELALSALALYLFVIAMWSTARVTYAIGRIWSIAVVGVPWVIVFLVVALVIPVLASFLGLAQNSAN